MDIDKDSNREAFEAIPENIRLLRGAKFKDGEYVALSLFDESSKELAAQLNYGWSMWLSAKAQAVPEWFDYTKQSPQIDGNYQIFIKGEQITAKWVSRFGFADPIEGDALRQELITHWAMQPQPPKAQEPAK